MATKAVQDKPTAAYLLSLIGGIIGLFVGFILIAITAIAAEVSSPYYSGPLALLWGNCGPECRYCCNRDHLGG